MSRPLEWRDTEVSPDGTHHRLGDRPLYAARFAEVLKFHAPGLAPVADTSGMYHIDIAGNEAYAGRFRRTFGFYEGLAAVDSGDGQWHHIRPTGEAAYPARWSWCGNVQGGRCAVRDASGRYTHIGVDGAPMYAERWRYAGDFKDGIGVVQAEDGRSTHVDTSGVLVHGRWFLDLDVFHKAFARAKDDLGWMHVDARGEPAYARRFAAVEPFYNGQARVERFDGALEVINERGAVVVELRPTAHSAPVEGKILARTAWGRVQLIEPVGGPPFVSKWTRGSNDREVEALLALREHPGAPKLLGRDRFDMNDRLRLSLCAGEVIGGPRRLRRFAESEALRITHDLLSVCAAMHASGWVHTDIHPGNVLDGTPATLLDFACAVRASYAHPWCGEINWGVWEYVPPELLADHGRIDPSADVYSAAALCVAMIRGAAPYRVDVERHRDDGGWPAVRTAFLAARKVQGLGDLRGELARVLARALDLDPAARPSAAQLREELAHV